MPGDKVYYNNRGKNIYLIRVGSRDVAEDGIRIVGAHIDSPRIDLKQMPLYESDGVALGKTHYYGGLRKYQWAAIPLAAARRGGVEGRQRAEREDRRGCGGSGFLYQ